MADINHVVLAGRLTRDGELRSTASGADVLGFGMCVNDRRKNQQTGEWEDVPNYVDVTVFGKICSWLAPMMVKGARVAVDGRLRWSSWERDGVKRSKLEVIADTVFPMATQQAQQAQDGYQQPYDQQQAAYVPPTLAKDASGGVSAVYQQQPQPQQYYRAPAQAPGQMALSADASVYREQMAAGQQVADQYGDDIPF